MTSTIFCLVLGLGWGAFTRRLTVFRAVGAVLIGALLAALIWLLEQMQSDLFVPSLSRLPIWIFDQGALTLFGLIVGFGVRWVIVDRKAARKNA